MRSGRIEWMAGAALLLVLGAAGCSQPQPNAAANGGVTAVGGNAKAGAPANVAQPAKKAENAAAAATGDEDLGEESAQAPDPDHDDASGATRQARCVINDEPATACSFTPVLGDGSFDIETSDRELRVIVDGTNAAVFERVGARRIPLLGNFSRDQGDRACWVADDQDAPVSRVCAY